MPDSNLNLTRNALRRRIGHYAGWGEGSAAQAGSTLGQRAWTDYELGEINFAVNEGLRWFYNTPAIPGHPGGHNWSFLRPITTVTVSDGDREAMLPDDFGGIDGSMVLSSPDETGFYPISTTSAPYVDQMYATNDSNTGRPTVAGVDCLKSMPDGDTQKYKLKFWPEADQTYTFKFQYYFNPNATSDTWPYVYGGAEHTSTIHAACMAAFELFHDEISEGPMWKQFVASLLGSIRMDQRKRPVSFGLNLDHSDEGMTRNGRLIDYVGSLATVEGVLYD